MATDYNALCDSDSGTVEDGTFEQIAIDRARALAESGEVGEEWVLPLVRAIQNRRLRIPTLSTTVNRVIQVIEAPEVDLEELAAVVSQDPGLSTKIMGVANSSYFRGVTEVESVRDALMRMGMREARTIVIVVALRSVVLRSPGQGSGATPLWRHSLLTAAATQEIASERPPWQAAGFLAGMVHDIGHMVIQAFAAELPAWSDMGDAPDADSVDRMSQALHSALGAHVLATWGFPVPFCEAVLHHHDTSFQLDGGAADLARILDLGNRLALQIEAGWPESPEEVAPELSALGAELGYSPEMLSDLAIEAEASFEALAKLG